MKKLSTLFKAILSFFRQFKENRSNSHSQKNRPSLEKDTSKESHYFRKSENILKCIKKLQVSYYLPKVLNLVLVSLKSFKFKKGTTLIELLVVVSVLLVITGGSMRLLSNVLEQQNLMHSQMSEGDLRKLVSGLNNTTVCTETFRGKAVGVYPSNELLIKSGSGQLVTKLEEGKLFKRNLEIVEMRTVSMGAGTNLAELEIYYSRPNSLFKYENPDEDCKAGNIAGDQDGCYDFKCKMDIVLDANSKIDTCKFLDCSSESVGGGISDDCYKVKVNGQTYVGCGTTKDNTQPTTTAFGFNAGHSGSGTNSTFIGHSAGKVSTGYSNTFIGHSAGRDNTLGYLNVFVGNSAGEKNTTGEGNTFVGNSAGEKNTTGEGNTFVGNHAGEKNSIGVGNTFVGNHAGENSTGDRNTFFGITAGWHNTTGEYNTFIGNSAGEKNLTGGRNTFVGMTAGFYNTTGEYNTFIGNSAGERNTTGDHNTFVGDNAGLQNTTGEYNTFIGKHAGFSAKGSGNIYIGTGANHRGPSNQVDKKFVIGNENYDENNLIAFADPWIEGDIGTDVFKVNTKQVAYNASSRTLKKNIKKERDYEKALKLILNVPLFSYEFKKDHPDKRRMGVISEELPEELQIKADPPYPDLPTLRGYLIASVKVLYAKLTEIKTQINESLNKLKEEFIEIKEQFQKRISTNEKALNESNKRLSENEKALNENNKRTSTNEKTLNENNKRLSTNEKELQETKAELKETKAEYQKELKDTKAALQNTKKELKELKEELQKIKKRI